MFIMSIIYLWIKALSVMSSRRPTVAFLLKPFLWRRPDVRLRYFFLSPLGGVAKMPDCGIIFLIFICSPFEASLQTPDRSLFMFCGISGGLPPFSLFTYPLCQFYLLCIKELIMLHPCTHLLYLTSELSCEYFQSTHWLVDLARCWWRRSHGWRVR